MKTLTGFWIDHREAVIVTLSDKGQETRRIRSDVEKQRRHYLPSSSAVSPGGKDAKREITQTIRLTKSSHAS